MAQVKHWENIEVDKKCRFCKEEKDFSIFWHSGHGNSFYVCRDCYYILRGLFIDVLLEKEEEENISITGQLNHLEKKIEGIKEMRRKNKM